MEHAPQVAEKSKTKRSRSGCVTCRIRKKKCTLEYPICGQCLRLNLVCERQEPRAYTRAPPGKSAPVASRAESETPSQPSSPTTARLALVPSLETGLFWVDAHALNRTSATSRRHLMRYYTQSFTKFLTTNLENNAFLTVFIPIAFECPAVADALVAWAATHLASRDGQYHNIATKSRSVALKSFHSSLDDRNTSIEAQLAASMIFCSMDSIGEEGKWFAHLEGAAAMLKSLANTEGYHVSNVGSRYQDSPDMMWLLRNFAYHDIMMAVSLDRMPLCTTKEFLRSNNDAAVDPYFGIASEILANMLDICDLNNTITENPNSDTPHSPQQDADLLFQTRNLFEDINEISSTAHDIAASLDAWTAPPDVDPLIEALGETYRSAALIYLYRTIRRRVPDLQVRVDGRIATQVKRIVDTAATMPPGCLPECTLLFPLFMAGSEAVKKDEISQIRKRMAELARSRSFQNVERAVEVLDELWRQRELAKMASEMKQVDWLDVVKRRKIELSLS